MSEKTPAGLIAETVKNILAKAKSGKKLGKDELTFLLLYLTFDELHEFRENAMDRLNLLVKTIDKLDEQLERVQRGIDGDRERLERLAEEIAELRRLCEEVKRRVDLLEARLG